MGKKDDFPMTAVGDSTSITAHGYDKTTRTMRIQFKNGGVYEYPDFPEDKYAAMTGAQSLCGYHAKHVRPHYVGRKVG